MDTTTSYLRDGLVDTVTEEPSGTTTHVIRFAYDAAGNPTKLTDALVRTRPRPSTPTGVDPVSWTLFGLGR